LIDLSLERIPMGVAGSEKNVNLQPIRPRRIRVARRIPGSFRQSGNQENLA
jgi:hypothetical protein